MIKKSSEEGKVVRICDICGDERLITCHSLYVNKKSRKRKLDLCTGCGTRESYRKNPQPVGDKNSRWKGGINNGYQLIYWRDSDGKVCKAREHRIVMEEKLGRPLSSAEIVHHIDMVKTNNSVENLFLCQSESQHQMVHASMQKCGFEMLRRHLWFDENRNIYICSKCSQKNLPEIIVSQKQVARKYGKHAYMFCRCPVAKRERPVHVLVCEKLMVRRLMRNEVVHHIDGNTLNNSINNLHVMSISDHMKSHKSLQECVAFLYKRGVIEFINGIYRRANA